MKRTLALSALLLSTATWAAGPKTNLIDHSNNLLIGEAEARSVMAEIIPGKLWKIYPASKYTMLSQVEGGMNGSTCVVAARVMLLPLTPTTRAVLFRPQKTATAFDAVVNSSSDACRTLAHEKLKEATQAVVSSIVKG